MFKISGSKKINKNMRFNYSSKSGVGLSGGVGPVKFNTKSKKKSRSKKDEGPGFFGHVLTLEFIAFVVWLFIVLVF